MILGGDVTGKMVILLVENSDGSYSCEFLGQKLTLKSPEELAKMEQKISFAGYYPYRISEKERQELRADEKKVEQLFEKLILKHMERWLVTAEERLKDKNIKCYWTGGNDDIRVIDPLLKSSKVIQDPDGEAVHIDDELEMISTSYSNRTPWNTPREITEEDLAKTIDQMASNVTNMERCIFNIHVPPHDSTLDIAPKLDTSVYPPRPMMGSGEAVFAAVGSTAVRAAIEKYQPLLGLHGHIHESRGTCKIGKTLCINPGSDYLEGILRGVLINISNGKVISHQFTSG